MTISTTDARQGVMSQNHAVVKVLVVSTSMSFMALAMIAILA